MPPRSGSGPVDVDWRRLASDRNIPPAVARELWERAQETSPDDPVLAERTFERLLDGAAAANATATPGRETLVGGNAPSDASSLGPGKWTRVLEAKKSPAGPEGLYADIAAAIRAGKRVAATLASSDQETLAGALREIRDGAGAGDGVLEKIVNAAGGAIERIIDARPQAAPAVAAAPAAEAHEPAEPETAPVTAAPDPESR